MNSRNLDRCARAAGQAVSGYLEVPALNDAGARIPVSLVRGVDDGPVLALIAGTHGYEYPGITALQRLRQSIDPRALRGTLILVHIANPPSFYGRTRLHEPCRRQEPQSRLSRDEPTAR